MPKRESKYVRIARIAYGLAQQEIKRYSHLKSPHRYTQPQLVACVLLTFYLNLSYRDAQEWLLASEQVCQELGLKEVPNYSTLNRTFQRFRLAMIERLQKALLQELEPEEEVIALDTTGFSPTQASLHFLTRCGRERNLFYKGGYAVGIESQLILGSKSDLGPGADTGFLEPLRRKASPYGKKGGFVIVADRGFDGKTVQPGDLIPPIRRGGWMKSPERIERMELYLAARMDGVYGQRWIVETVNSVIKRKFGENIRSRKALNRHREPIVKGLIYNIHV